MVGEKEAARLGILGRRGVGSIIANGAGVSLVRESGRGGALKYVHESSREIQLEHGGPFSSHCCR